ncbi:unconventional myosin-X-like [Ptychodera flava]|uniref:unconventional myosin-X-like n=1 Tax=Ptychodera flava TaxID=63121 RepID=UPI00396A8C03
MDILTPGNHVWLFDDKLCKAATVEKVDNNEVTLSTNYGETKTYPVKVGKGIVTAMHQSSIQGVEDMSQLADLHEAAILHNLQIRYQKDKIYTYISSILVAVNPYKVIDSLYDSKVMQHYDKKHIGDTTPHIYAIANECYYSMWKSHENQCVLISGESGAGKTESTKFILNYLSEMSQLAALHDNESRVVSVEQAILQSSPILEAFGNAKTIYNNNSSRFGKFIQLQFSEQGNITSGKIKDFLLEKNRVVGQNPGERNYHVFYSLLAGAPEELKESLKLKIPEAYRYLNQSGCIDDPSIDDQGNFEKIQEAMRIMKFKESDISDIFSVIAAVLHLGNMEFITAGGAQLSNRSALQIVSKLLGLDEYQFSDAMTQKSMILRGEEILQPLEIDQAEASRDSLAMNLYARCFQWIISKINSCVRGADNFCLIGVLDIFGFENFEVNRFEQFNINYANEKLQEYFNKHIFSLEQHEYNTEGLTWVDIDWSDNGECLDLIERKLGILALIDEESRFPKGTDQSMLTKLHRAHFENAFYTKPRITNTKFGIKHYAGEVFYDSVGFLEKNRDTFRDDLLMLLKESRSDFVYDMFESVKAMKANDTKTIRKKATVSFQFKDSLHSLMNTLSTCNPYFVRCVKPNSAKLPEQFDAQLVMNQLKYSGMLETVKIRRAGFPVRRLFEDFIKRYKVLIPRGVTEDDKEKCVSIMVKYDESKKNWQLGKTKVFLREQLEYQLEAERQEHLNRYATRIQAYVKAYVAKKKYKRIVQFIVVIQKTYKAHFYKMKYLHIRKAIIKLQAFARRIIAKNIYAQKLEEKRIEEERLREEQRRREEEERKELERLEQEKKMRELEELKRKLDEEARLKREREEAQRLKEEAERQAALAKARELEEARRLEEEEARRKAEEERKRREEELARQKAEEAERKRQEEERKRLEEERLREEAEEMRRQEELRIAELQALNEFDSSLALYDEDAAFHDEEDEDTTKRMQESAFNEGYLTMKGGVMNTWKKRWFVLRDNTLMWFKAKQEALKSGWLLKKGGGTGTLSRRNWKKRWFVLKDTILSYYDSDAENAKQLGRIDIRAAKDIVDASSDRENALNIVTYSRTYYLVADTADDCSEWYAILMKVLKCKYDELKDLEDEQANPKNAIGSLDVALIDSLAPVNLPSRPNAFAMVTAGRVYNLIANSPEEMNTWLTALYHHRAQRGYKKEDVLMSGWLSKESPGSLTKAGSSKKKRYFELTSNTMDFYKSVDSQQKLGTIVLNSLCSVIPPDEKAFRDIGAWRFMVHGRKHSYNLHTLSYDEAWRWVCAVQDVIDSKPQIETPTQQLFNDIKEAAASGDTALIDQIYTRNPILRNTPHTLKAPLLPLPYGQLTSTDPEKGYTSLQEEAVKVFSTLQGSENVGDPVPVIQGIMQTCHDLRPLRDEVYCQLMKQTTGIQDPDSLNNLRNWQIMACMSCTFVPSRKILRHLKFHLKRQVELYPESQMAKYAQYALQTIKRTRSREFVPSREEIIACLARREMNATVFCYGGGSCQISINSATTTGEVIKTLLKGMSLDKSPNKFALFEKSSPSEKVIEERTILADILAKFEQYKAQGIGNPKEPWKLFFKIHCFMETVAVDRDSVEYAFMFEQAHEQVLHGQFPASEETLLYLAALRLQYVKGNYINGIWIDDLGSYYCLNRLKSNKPPKEKENESPVKTQEKRENIIVGTLRGLGRGTLRKLQKASSDDSLLLDEVFKEDLSATTTSVIEKWKSVMGLTAEEAQEKYMNVIRRWPGYGSTIFDVEGKEGLFLGELWIGVSGRTIAFFRRGDTKPIDEFSYEKIMSFGAPLANEYKIVVEGHKTPFIFETSQVFEIAKLMKAYINEIVRKRHSVAMDEFAMSRSPIALSDNDLI